MNDGPKEPRHSCRAANENRKNPARSAPFLPPLARRTRVSTLRLTLFPLNRIQGTWEVWNVMWTTLSVSHSNDTSTQALIERWEPVVSSAVTKLGLSADQVLRGLSARLVEGFEVDRPEEEERPVAVEKKEKKAKKDFALLRGGRTFLSAVPMAGGRRVPSYTGVRPCGRFSNRGFLWPQWLADVCGPRIWGWS